MLKLAPEFGAMSVERSPIYPFVRVIRIIQGLVAQKGGTMVSCCVTEDGRMRPTWEERYAESSTS